MEVSKIGGSVAAFFIRFILAFGAVILAMITAGSLLVHGHMENSIMEYMELVRNGWDFYVLTALFAVLLICIKKPLQKITPLKLFIILAILYAIAGGFLIIAAPPEIRSDAYMIHKHALEFLSDDYSGLAKGSYLYTYPFQLGMVTYEMGILSIWNSTKALFTANLLSALLTIFFAWKSAELIYEETAVKYTILLSFGFLPLLYYILFAYGWLPGLFFANLGGYFLIRYKKGKGALNLLPAALSFAAAYLLKTNYIVAVLAAGIVLFIHAVKCADAKKLLTCLLVVLIPILCNTAFLQAWREISNIDFENGHQYPLVMVMGLMPEEEGSGRRGGWYNGFNVDTFSASGYDPEVSREMAKEKFEELKVYWSEDYKRTFDFFRIKVLTGWCDPLYQSIWVGPMEWGEQYVTVPIAHNLYTGGILSTCSEKYADSFMVLLYLGALLYCIMSLKTPVHQEDALLWLLFMIGGFLFHLVSEMKSQYIIILVFGLIPYAAHALVSITDRFDKNP